MYCAARFCSLRRTGEQRWVREVALHAGAHRAAGVSLRNFFQARERDEWAPVIASQRPFSKTVQRDTWPRAALSSARNRFVDLCREITDRLEQWNRARSGWHRRMPYSAGEGFSDPSPARSPALFRRVKSVVHKITPVKDMTSACRAPPFHIIAGLVSLARTGHLLAGFVAPPDDPAGGCSRSGQNYIVLMLPGQLPDGRDNLSGCPGQPPRRIRITARRTGEGSAAGRG